ncbi:iron-containing alcohol dehydrogenase [Pseudomaricurvus alkylphenolicus]|uniref:iron-containing alcohol dehydrogenase n=1 Tax=Pseudomaricurvus alkylphenolicus TaxID=1306991 RepID=UPI001F0E4584|nr:iron-containing alcohol dehydrogenase [Pseudomaricurvus alkylphenolicus]
MKEGLTLYRTYYGGLQIYRPVSPERIVSGVGSAGELPRILRHLGVSRPIIATSNSVATRTPLVDHLSKTIGYDDITVFSSCGQYSPEDDINALNEVLTVSAVDCIIAVGGNSVLDTVKLATGRQDIDSAKEPIPQIVLPTTLSAGEFTPEVGRMEGATDTIRWLPDMWAAPKAVILDPVLTLYTPDELWLATGFQALAYAMEAVWSHQPHPYVDTLALEAISVLTRELPRARGENSLEARAACQISAWMSTSDIGAKGRSLSRFLGHQIESALDISHGVMSCVLLPTIMRLLATSTIEAQVRIDNAMGIKNNTDTPLEYITRAGDFLEKLAWELGLPTTISAAGRDISELDAIASDIVVAAETLGMMEDLPEGVETIKALLRRVCC